MRLPNLLIIGAMKAGTTSLYFDLVDHAGLFLAENKEPHNLCHQACETYEGKAAYAKLYEGAGPQQLLCDASTGYAKLPVYQGVPQRACQILPPDFKVLYMLRHPVERALSHYRHELINGHAGRDPNVELRERSEFIDFSRYAYQLQPWLEAIGQQRVHVVIFEEYVDNRQKVIREICDFLDRPVEGDLSAPAQIYNQSADKPRPIGTWARIRHSWPYQKLVRPLLPIRYRLRLYKVLLPRPSGAHTEFTRESHDWMLKQLSGDTEELSRMIGRNDYWLGGLS